MTASTSLSRIPIVSAAPIWTPGQTQVESRVFFVNFSTSLERCFARRRPISHGFGKTQKCVRSVNFAATAPSVCVLSALCARQKRIGFAQRAQRSWVFLVQSLWQKAQKRVRSFNFGFGVGLRASRQAGISKPRLRVRSVNFTIRDWPRATSHRLFMKPAKPHSRVRCVNFTFQPRPHSMARHSRRLAFAGTTAMLVP